MRFFVALPNRPFERFTFGNPHISKLSFFRGRFIAENKFKQLARIICTADPLAADR